MLLKLRLHVVGPVEPIFVREVDDGNPCVACLYVYVFICLHVYISICIHNAYTEGALTTGSLVCRLVRVQEVRKRLPDGMRIHRTTYKIVMKGLSVVVCFLLFAVFSMGETETGSSGNHTPLH